jgi:LCP family protein required for cell wall assembly
VRTSLKRGLGRSGLDGAGPVVLPPSAPSPVSRYRQPPPRRRPLLVRALGWLGAAITMLVFGLLGGAYLFFHQTVAAISAHTPAVKAAARRLNVPLPGQAAIALLIGYDHRANQASSDPSRSDTIMLVRTDPQRNAISLLSLPRDLVTNIVCPGHPTYVDRINAAYAECGPKGTVLTVRALTGLPINYLVTVNFHGFKEIVNTLGGVWIDVDRRYYHSNAGLPTSEDYAQINLMPGYQKLSGGAALDYVRYRHTDSDLYRVLRQQAFVKALKQQIGQSFSVWSLPSIVGSIARNVEVGVGGGGHLSDRTVLSYALFGFELPAGHFFQIKLDNLTQTGPGGGELASDTSSVASAIQQFTNPDTSAPAQATQLALGLKPTKKAVAAPPASATPITVLNGNGVAGSAATAAYLLRQRGYPTVNPAGGAPANAPTFDYFQSVVYYPRGRQRLRAAATALANLLAPARISELPRSVRPTAPAELAVVVGKTFHDAIAPRQLTTSAPTKPQPPQVTYQPQTTLPLLEPFRRRAGFPLELPTVLDTGSYPDSAMPARLYAIQGEQNAVRLVYHSGLDYWGVEETAWNGAPILAGRNFHHTIAGRSYDLYYNGPHLHMAVLHQNGANYWVINSLQDTLTNQTVLAIAKGLKPLRR